MPDVQIEQLANMVTIGGGAAEEKFLAEFRAVLENIRDPNTQAKGKRKVVMEWVFQPDEDRERVFVEINSECVTQKTKPAGDVMFVGKHDGETVATVMHREGDQRDPRQGILELKKGGEK